jgi:hypothetical protein
MKRPLGIVFIIAFNIFALFITLIFWGLVYFKRLVPPPESLAVMSERANAATTYAFMFGDIIWAVSFLLISIIGLWKMRFWGWTFAQMTNALWFYSMTVIWIRDAYTTISPGAVLFLPFALVAVWQAFYLWNVRERFGVK